MLKPVFKPQTFLVFNRISTSGRSTAKILNELGYSDVRQAYTIESAKEIIRGSEDPVLVILEVTSLRYATAEFDFLNWLQGYKSRWKIPVVATSLQVEKNTVKKFFSLGVNSLILKSSNLASFSERLKIHLDRIEEPALPA